MKQIAGDVGIATVVGVVELFRYAANSLKGWNEANVQQFHQMRQLWEKHINASLPEELRLREEEKDFKLTQPFFESLQHETVTVSYWEGRWQDVSQGYFVNQTRELVRSVCAYLQNANPAQNWFQKQYSLPRHFFLHEVLTWLCHSLHAYKADDFAELRSLRSRLNYFLAVEKADVFPLDKNWFGLTKQMRITIRQVLAKLILQLSKKVIPEMEQRIREKSAVHRFQQLAINISGALVDDTLQVLYYILSSGKPSESLMVDELLKSGLHATVTKSMLVMLARHQTISHKYSVASVLGQKQNPFYDSNGALCIPAEILTRFKIRDTAFATAFSDSKSGVFLEICKNVQSFPLLCKEFVQIHALTWELVESIEILSKMQKVAEDGGSVLLYGIHQGQVFGVLEVVALMLNRLAQSYEILHEQLSTMYWKRIDEQVDPGDWDINFRMCKAPVMVAEIHDIVAGVLCIRQDCEALSLAKRVEQLQQNMESFMTGASLFIERAELLHLGRSTSQPQLQQLRSTPSQLAIVQSKAAPKYEASAPGHTSSLESIGEEDTSRAVIQTLINWFSGDYFDCASLISIVEQLIARNISRDHLATISVHFFGTNNAAAALERCFTPTMRCVFNDTPTEIQINRVQHLVQWPSMTRLLKEWK